MRDSYKDPVYTYETNVMGTVNVLECVRLTGSVKSFLNVTTDKVYDNREWEYGYRETDPLDGYDPYSNSKSCSELVTHSYKKSFFQGGRCAVSTCRAGNVIGGGDYANFLGVNLYGAIICWLAYLVPGFIAMKSDEAKGIEPNVERPVQGGAAQARRGGASRGAARAPAQA